MSALRKGLQGVALVLRKGSLPEWAETNSFTVWLGELTE